MTGLPGSLFMFYIDPDAYVYSNRFEEPVCKPDRICGKFKYLGSYSEVI